MAEFLKEQKLLKKSQIESQTDLNDVATPEEVLKGKVTALLFSASWCPPCQKFLPILKTFYGELKDSECPIEVVFVSLDHTKESMEDYFIKNHGDWFALPFDESLKDEITSKYHITAIPKLVVIRENGEVITLRGRKDVQDKGTSCFRSWLNNSIPRDYQNQNNFNTADANKAEETLAEQGGINSEMLALKQEFLENADNLDAIQGEVLAQLIDATILPQEHSSSNVSFDAELPACEENSNDNFLDHASDITLSEQRGEAVEEQRTTNVHEGYIRAISTIPEEVE